MISQVLQLFGAPCGGGGFLGFPAWYKYLDGVKDPNNGLCAPQMSGINDVWLVLAALIEILLRVAALMAVAFVIYGAASYMTSQGEPDKTTKARRTIINALVGLAIAIIAGATVGFIAGRFN
jgi:hypothetical protein